MKTEVVSGQRLYDTVQSLLAGQSPMSRALLFGGERLSVCDEGVALKFEGQVVGLATIAPEGEATSNVAEAQSGTPTIVGLYVRPEDKGDVMDLLRERSEFNLKFRPENRLSR